MRKAGRLENLITQWLISKYKIYENRLSTELSNGMMDKKTLSLSSQDGSNVLRSISPHN